MTLQRNSRWSYSWLLSLIAGMTVVVVLTGILGLHFFEEQLVKSEGENLALVAVDITEKFNLLLIELQGDLQLLGDTASRVAWDRKRWTAHLHAMKTAYPHYQSLVLIGPTGRVLAATDESTMGVDVSGDKWFHDVSDNHTGILVWDVSPNVLSQGIETVSVAVPLSTDPSTGPRSFQGAVVGLIGVPMLEKIVTRTLHKRTVDQSANESLEYQVMNEQGQLFIDSDLYHKGNVNLMTIGQVSARLAQSGKAGYIEEEHLRRHVQLITGYAQFIGKKEQSNIRWGVLVRADRQAVLAPLRSMLWKIGLVSGSLVLPMLAIFLWVVRQLELTRISQQRTQAKLEESHTFLQSTLDALPSHIAILDEQGTIVAVNGMWRKFAVDNQSTDPHHMVGKNYLEVCDTAEGSCSEEAKEVAKGIRALLKGVGNQCVFEYPCHGRDEQRWFMVRISRFDLEGNFSLVVAHENITERKLEEHRKATLYTITRLLSGAKNLEEVGPYIMETICHALSWNVGALWKVDEGAQALRCAEVWSEKASFAPFIESTRRNSFAIGVGLPGRAWKNRKAEWIIDVGCDSNFPRIAAATSVGLRAAFAFPIGIRDRLYGVMEFFSTALREPDKKLLDLVEGLAGQMSQFLDRKQSEQSLNYAKNKAEAAARERAEILAAVEAFFICVNGEGAVTTWTPRAEAIFGISLEKALGLPFTELPIQWNWKEVSVAMEKAKDTINSIRVEKIRLAHQNGKEVYLKLTVSPICDDRGVTYVFMGEDISDRLALEHDLVQAQKLESIGHLAAGVAHEINTPTQFVGDNVRFLSDSFSDLAAVLDRHRALLLSVKAGACAPDLIEACETEARRVDLDYLTEEIPKAIAQSSEGVTRIATIVRAMKEFAHPGSDEKTYVDLNKAIESTVTVSRNEWKYIANLTTDLAPDLPLVPCLLGQFNQVILNMIVNATHSIADVIKGTGARGTISIATRSVDRWAEVRITDSGTGIPEEIRRKIFDPFFTTKEVGKGTGQGLAIAHSVIVDKHRGTIALESEVGRGTTFIVRLPLDLQATTVAAEMAA